MCILLFYLSSQNKTKCKALLLRSLREATTPPAVVVLSLQNLAALLSATRGKEDALFGFIVHRRRLHRQQQQQQQQHPPGREDAIFIFT